MKTGLLTFHSAYHYGAMLQAYALMKAITMTGAECEIINYVREDTIDGNKLFKRGLSFKSMLSNAHTLLNYGRLKMRNERYKLFMKEKMILSKKFYGTYKELKDDAPAYDIYVCGSDQIWNPLIYKENTFDPAFFADFAKSGKRVAYAPSFGITEIPEANREVLKKYLDKFECLSVREKQGEKIINDMTGRESVTVLDPTLLLTGDDWGGISAEPIFKKPYILCYFISDPTIYSKYVKELSDKYKLPIVSLCGARRVVSGTAHTILDAGPREFLSLFRNASFICTNSFHGTVFSINFKKNFISFTTSLETGKTVNSRLYNILERLGLLSRIFTSDTDLKSFASQLESDKDAIDYSKVEINLNNEREMSLKYLKEALKQ